MPDSLSTSPPSRRPLFAAFLFYLVILLLAFVPKWLAGHSFLTEVLWDPTPVYLQYPADVQAISSLAAGQLPLWDPARGLGTPSFVPVHLTFFNLLKSTAYLLHCGCGLAPRYAGWELYLFLRLLLAGFGTFLLARALPLRFAAALLAGAGYMLCGYFRVFIAFQHLNLEAFFPLVLWSLLALSRKPSLARMLALLFFLVQIWAGGNPSSLAYALVLAGAFSLFLAISPPCGHRSSRPALRGVPERLRPLLIWVGLTLFSGLLCGYIPTGIEFAGQAANLRWPGLGSLYIPLTNLVALVTPVFDYWLSPLPPTGDARLALLNFVPGYLGLGISTLALLALLHPGRLPRAGLFFALALPFALGLVLGIPPFALLSRLPVLNASQNFRYAQPYLALSAALAAGMGLDLLLAPESSRLRWRTFVILAVLLLWILGQAVGFRTLVLASPLLPRLAAMAALALAGVGAVLLAARSRLRDRSRASLSALGLAAAAIAELLICFHLAAPLYGPQAYSVTEPPAAAWLRGQPGRFRLLGAEPEALHPNLAGLYGLEDARDSTPIYTRRYLQLVSALDGLKTPSAVLEHYFENGRFYLDLDLKQTPPRILDLLNVRYVLSRTARDRRPLPLDDETVRGLAPAPGRNFVSRIEATVAGVHRPALFTHAPSRADLTLPSSSGAALVGDAGVLPEASQNPSMDGVFMTAAARTGAGSTLVFSRFLNPRSHAGERAWIPLEASLPPGAEALSLSALPGPRDNNLSDFAVWGEPGLRQPDPRPGLNLVYDRDLRIYENRTAWPRAFWLTRVESLDSDEEVWRRLSAAEFNPAREGLVHARSPQPEIPAPAGPAEVELVEHNFGRAAVRVQARGGGLLVLSDLYYPGWEARVDGREARIYPVDLALRGLPLPGGTHQVTFRYRPVAVRLAVWMTWVGGLFALLLWWRQKPFSLEHSPRGAGPPEKVIARLLDSAPVPSAAPRCPLCGSASVSPWLPRTTGPLGCRGCGTIFWPGFESWPVERLYDQDYYFRVWPQSLGRFFREFDPAAHFKTRFMAGQVQKLQKLDPQARVLDVGCSNGVFVWLAERAGLQAEGIDISNFAVAWGRKQFGVNLRMSRLDEVEESGAYDLLSFWDTLEHMRDPAAALGQAHRL